MKTKILHITQIVVFSLVFSLGMAFVQADWTPPQDTNGNALTPPNCPSGAKGCDAPIHVGSTAQTKAGPLITYWLGLISGGKLVFSNETGERAIFYNSSNNPLTPGSTGNLAFGVQNSTFYMRTGSANNINFYRGGAHSDTQGDPGAGGSVFMQMGASAGDLKTYAKDYCLFLTGTNTPDPTRCLSAVIGGTGSSVTELKGTLTIPSGQAFIEASGTRSPDPVTIAGAAIGDTVVVGLPSNYYYGGYSTTDSNGNNVYACGPVSATVDAPNHVYVQFYNVNSSRPCAVPPGTYKIKVLKQ